ncbi:MAG: hypothetical protein DMF12_01335 [Verrucomicrobia bacterium]|nr:MAG: hypothetical protein DMF12_01335 [Verrucomicrobiota bacterium]
MKAQWSRRSCGEGKTTRDDCISGKRGSKGFELFAERSRAARKTERRSSMSLRFGLAAALKRSIVLFFSRSLSTARRRLRRSLDPRTNVVGNKLFPTPPLPLMMRLICLFAEGCVDQSMRRSAMREPRMRGRCAGLITGVDVGDSKVVENAMIAGPATGSPTIHVLNVTASAIESLTMSWWCSSYWRPR